MAVKFIKQCSFIWMLLLSVVIVYVVSFVGVKSGWLKENISWAHPIFVSLLTHEVNDGNGTSLGSGNNGAGGDNGMPSQPWVKVDVAQGDKKDEGSTDDTISGEPSGENDSSDNNGADDGTGAADSNKKDTPDTVTDSGNTIKGDASDNNGDAQTTDGNTGESGEISGTGSANNSGESSGTGSADNSSETSGTGNADNGGEISGTGSADNNGETSGTGSSGDSGNSAPNDGEYSGQVKYVTTSMRHARSAYYSDFDTIALSSQLDYVEVDNDYFSNACFIGDSRMEGLYFYGDLREADFYYKAGVTVYDIMNKKLECNGDGGEEITSALSRKQYSHIYMMVGVNELGDKTPEEYAKAYSDDIATIRSLQPNAIIFIIGIMHVTTSYSNSNDVFNNDNIDARNAAIAAIANGKDIFYLDMNECVDDGNGGIIGDYSFDGVHLKAEYYKLWTEWMKAHGVKNLIK